MRNIIEKGASICVIIPQNRKVKKNSTSHYPSEFRAQQYRDKLTKKKQLESLEEKKAVHTSCKLIVTTEQLLACIDGKRSLVPSSAGRM